jgi:hypothetical protein
VLITLEPQKEFTSNGTPILDFQLEKLSSDVEEQTQLQLHITTSLEWHIINNSYPPDIRTAKDPRGYRNFMFTDQLNGFCVSHEDKLSSAFRGTGQQRSHAIVDFHAIAASENYFYVFKRDGSLQKISVSEDESTVEKTPATSRLSSMIARTLSANRVFSVSPDDRLFCVSLKNKHLYLGHLNDFYNSSFTPDMAKECLLTMPDGAEAISCAYSSDNSLLSVCTKNKTYIIAVEDKVVLASFEIGDTPPTCCRFLLNDVCFVIGFANGEVKNYSTVIFYALFAKYLCKDDNARPVAADIKQILDNIYAKFYAAKKDDFFNVGYDKVTTLALLKLFEKHNIFSRVINDFFTFPISLQPTKMSNLLLGISASLQRNINTAQTLADLPASQDMYSNPLNGSLTPQHTPSYSALTPSAMQVSEESFDDTLYSDIANRAMKMFQEALLAHACNKLAAEQIEWLRQQNCSMRTPLVAFIYNVRQTKSRPITFLIDQLEKEAIEGGTLATLFVTIEHYLQAEMNAKGRSLYKYVLGLIAYHRQDYVNAKKYLSEPETKPHGQYLLGKAYYEGHIKDGNYLINAMDHLFKAKPKNKLAEKFLTKNRLILVRQLTTYLIYRAQRHDFTTDAINQKLKIYILDLNPNTHDWNINKFRDFIQKVETTHRNYYGTELSDDSDDDEEQNYQKLKLAVKEPTVKFYEEFLAKADFKKLLAELGKINDEDIHRLPQRTKSLTNIFRPAGRIPEPFQLEPREKKRNSTGESKGKTVHRELNRLNNKSPEERKALIAGLSNKYVIAQYRSINYTTKYWNAEQRRKHRKLDEINKPIFAPVVYEHAGLDFNAELEINLPRLNAACDHIRHLLAPLRTSGKYKGARKEYDCKADFLHEQYTMYYDKFHEACSAVCPGLSRYQHKNPFLSTSDTPLHALRYAYGRKPFKNHKEERLAPRWNQELQAERPYSGKLYLSLHPLEDYAGPHSAVHLQSLHTAARIELLKEILPERETTFIGKIEPNRIKYTHVAKYPSFKESYKDIYLYKYGLKVEAYNELKRLFQTYPPHSEQRSYLKQLLGEYLCAFYEVRLFNKAEELAREMGAILIYQDENGFTLQPPDNAASGDQPHIQATKDYRAANKRLRLQSTAGSPQPGADTSHDHMEYDEGEDDE